MTKIFTPEGQKQVEALHAFINAVYENMDFDNVTITQFMTNALYSYAGLVKDMAVEDIQKNMPHAPCSPLVWQTIGLRIHAMISHYVATPLNGLKN